MILKVNITHDVSLDKLTTWRIGGLADWLIEISDCSDMLCFLREASESGIPWLILGNGSNILFSDDGFRGAIVTLGSAFRNISVDRDHIRVGAGAQLSQLANQAAAAGLTGLEPLAGIPGTVGGAAFVNAGAFGCSLLQLCCEINGFDHYGQYKSFDDIHPVYRCGGFPAGTIITELQVSLTSGEPSRIHELMIKYLEQRRSTQPLSEASAGCTFRNPENTGAGRLIDGLGLKGFQIGRAMISTRHANFIINSGEATATDVIKIIRHVRREVRKVHGINLDLEVLVLDEQGCHLDPGGDLE